MIQHCPRTSRHWQSGSAVVELALVSVLLAVMIFGAIDLGRTMYTYIEIIQSTRAAARYLATSPSVGSDEVARAKTLVVYGSFSNAGSPLANELAGDEVLVKFCAPSYCDIAGKTMADMTNVAVAGSGTVDLVMVQVSGLTLISYFPETIANVVFRPITAVMPRVG